MTYKLSNIELNKGEVLLIEQAIIDMDLEVHVQKSNKEGYDIVSEDRGFLMEIFDLISFELNLVEEDVIAF